MEDTFLDMAADSPVHILSGPHSIGLHSHIPISNIYK